MIKDITIKLLNEDGEMIEERSFQANTPLSQSHRIHEGNHIEYIEELTRSAEMKPDLNGNYQILIEVRQI
jgi:hypothetical protein